MKNEPHLPRIIALGILAVIVLLLLPGCVSSKYQKARKDTPPPPSLDVAFAPAPLEATLGTLITYNGPGSWKRNAFWDEYVVTLHNPGREPLIISSAGLVDFAGTGRVPRAEPWKLEKESKDLERQYQDAGIAFVRYTAPAVVIVGAGAVAIGSAGAMTAAGGAAIGATLIALPVYYVGVLAINHHNKGAMEKEFNRRRLVLPLTLAPGETRTGSCFFPMVPNPRSLNLQWSTAGTSGETALSLDFLRGLHAAPTTVARR